MSEHTPGPLEVGYYTPSVAFKQTTEHVAVMQADGALVALTGPVGDAQSEADALLYAAAPDLLAACIAARNLLVIANAGLILHGRPINQSAQEKVDMLNAAIAKANGTEAAS